jgi:hypothetical protein
LATSSQLPVPAVDVVAEEIMRGWIMHCHSPIIFDQLVFPLRAGHFSASLLLTSRSGAGSARGGSAAGDGIAHVRKDDRDRPCLPLEGDGLRGPVCHDDVGLQTDQLLREHRCPGDVIAVPPKVHPYVAAIGPTQARKRLRERGEAVLPHGIVFVALHEHADAPYAVALLRARRDRLGSIAHAKMVRPSSR